MSTTYFDTTAHLAATAAVEQPKVASGIWGRVLAALISAREIQAKRETNRFLARQPDRFLRDIGLDEADIAELRHAEGI